MLSPKIKINILSSCPHTFTSNIVGEAVKICREFILGDHVLKVSGLLLLMAY